MRLDKKKINGVIKTDSLVFKDIGSIVFAYGLLNSLTLKGDGWSCIVSRGQRSS